jgi:hypothetical protein
MRARVHDATGPGRWRLLQAAFGPVFFLILLASAWDHLADLPTQPFVAGAYQLVFDFDPPWGRLIPVGIVALSAIFALLWPALLVRRRSRVVSVHAHRGLIRLGWAILPGDRIASAGVESIRTVRAAEGVSLVVVRRHGSPVFLELDDEEAARSIAASLSEGGAGICDLSFEARMARRTIRDGIELIIRALGILCWILFFVSSSGLAALSMDISTTYYYLVWDGIWGAFHLTGLFCVPAALLFHLLRHYRRQRLVLEDRELRVGNAVRIKYIDITSVNVIWQGIGLGAGGEQTLLEIHLPGLSRAELAHVAAHIVSAVQEAKGTYEDRSVAPAWLEVLSRGTNEPVSAWLSRLDAVHVARGGDPYRRAPFDREQLASTIDDPHAPVALRVAAARVLRRIDPADARKRVGKLDARNEPDAARRLRIAIERDIGEASEAYETLPPLFRVLEPEGGGGRGPW